MVNVTRKYALSCAGFVASRLVCVLVLFFQWLVMSKFGQYASEKCWKYMSKTQDTSIRGNRHKASFHGIIAADMLFHFVGLIRDQKLGVTYRWGNFSDVHLWSRVRTRWQKRQDMWWQVSFLSVRTSVSMQTLVF
ncbi:hypothetical protein V8F06_007375 [Rhypophila decipiens]